MMLLNWFDRWHSKNPSNGFTNNTFLAAKHTTMGMIELIKYLLTKDEIRFVLPGLIQSDFIEGRFGWYRY